MKVCLGISGAGKEFVLKIENLVASACVDVYAFCNVEGVLDWEIVKTLPWDRRGRYVDLVFRWSGGTLKCFHSTGYNLVAATRF